MTDVKAFVFDWGGVLIEDPLENILKFCARHFGIEYPLFKKEFKKYANFFTCGKISETELWQKIGIQLKIVNAPKESLWEKAFEKNYQPRELMFQLVHQLKNKNFITALLSNTELPSQNYFIKQNYTQFDFTIFSCSTGYAKPDQEIFFKLIHTIKCPASNIIFIDDKLKNIKSASSLGIKSIMFKNYEQTKSQLSTITGLNFL